MNVLMTLARIALVLAPLALAAQDSSGLSSKTPDGRLAPLLANLGSLHMPITTSNADTQKYFDQGIRLIYGFNHAEALRSFREAARNDDSCAMTYWGQALALAPNINDSAIGPDREQQGYNAIQEAVKRRNQASDREKALIDALAARFTAKPPKGNRKALNQAYAKAMEKAWRRFPKDPDVAVLYADAVMNTQPWNYWFKGNKPKPGVANARKALEQTIQAVPDHPGALHTYIHLMEASDFVDLAVPSADHLGPLMPGAGHLVHMPSHIYIRVGRYGDAASANIKAVAADEDYITQCRVQGIYPATYYPHNIHFLAAALVMEGRGKEAMETAQKAAHHHGDDVPEGLMGFAQLLEALPRLVMIRFGMWDQVLASPAPDDKHSFVAAVHHFARGMAFSANGKAAEAKEELALTETLAKRPELKDQKILDLNSLADIAQIGIAMLRGDIAVKAGQYDAAVAAFQKAVELDGALLYSEPPDWFIPPRQYLAQAYLAAGKAADAERVYRADLNQHRENGWSLRGLEESLRKQGKSAEADQTHKNFEQAWQRSDVQLASSRF